MRRILTAAMVFGGLMVYGAEAKAQFAVSVGNSGFAVGPMSPYGYSNPVTYRSSGYAGYAPSTAYSGYGYGYPAYGYGGYGVARPPLYGFRPFRPLYRRPWGVGMGRRYRY